VAKLWRTPVLSLYFNGLSQHKAHNLTYVFNKYFGR
jgi:hypothetical protein